MSEGAIGLFVTVWMKVPRNVLTEWCALERAEIQIVKGVLKP